MSVVQLLSYVWLCDLMDCSNPGFSVLHHLLEFAQIHVYWVCDAIQPSHPLSSPSIFPSIRVFSRVSASHQVANILELQLQHQSLQWIFRTDILEDELVDLVAVQGTLKSFLQHISSKASILWHSAFFIVQLSHANVTTGKTITSVIWIFVGKVMSLLFNILSRLLIAFLSRNKYLLISWL